MAKAVIFDYIGTLVNCIGYSMEASRKNLYTALVNEGFDIAKDKFLEAYLTAHEKYRIIRYEELREVTNAVWVAEALANMGFRVTKDNDHVKAALNDFFKTYIDTFQLRPGSRKLVEQAAQCCRIGLISNFTHAPVIYSSLRKLRINNQFNTVTISEENGWRKPSIHIFQDALNKLNTEAEDAVFIGDSPLEDIKGAKDAGLKTVFVESQFYTLKDLINSKQEPDYIAKDLKSISKNFFEITGF